MVWDAKVQQGQVVGGDIMLTAQVTSTPSYSEPPLWLWAPECQTSGGLGSHVAPHTAPEEMHHSGPAYPHVSTVLGPSHWTPATGVTQRPSPHTCYLPRLPLTPVTSPALPSHLLPFQTSPTQ